MTPAVPLDDAYAERVYAGVVGKLVGVYLGRPVEGWAFDDIQARFGLVDRYVAEELGLPIVVADDDISGTLAFARAVEDHPGVEVGASEVAKTWLNYIIEDKTILWWGGYGRSTEHTAFLNLRDGMDAPASGSIATNGATLAEQIGAQIFSDAFALLHPGDPARAAALTRAAASVSHDRVALDAAAFFAAARAQAFVTSDLDELIATGRREVTDERLLRLIDDVVAHVHVGDDWRRVRAWVDERYGYHLYPGPCHALSNTAMVLAALRLAGDDAGLAVAVASSVGFDTDSNAGTVGCLNGVRLGLAAIPGALREPIADRAIVVSADGGEAVTDAVLETRRLVASARRLRGRDADPPRARFDFSFPGSRQGFTACPHAPGAESTVLADARGGGIRVSPPEDAVAALSTPTFLDPRDAASNFSTVASPTLYPGDEVSVDVDADGSVEVGLYALYDADGTVERRTADAVAVGGTGAPVARTLTWTVPAVGNLVPFRIGLEVRALAPGSALTVRRMDWTDAPSHFAQSGILLTSIWDTHPAGLAPWVSSARDWEADFAGTYCVSHPGEGGVVTIGTRAWRDYGVTSVLTPSIHRTAGLVVRARGHRNYCAGVFADGVVRLIDQVDDERRVLAEVVRPAALDTPVTLTLTAVGADLALEIDGEVVLRARTTRPERGGGAGFLVERGTFTADGFTVRRADRRADRTDPSSDSTERKAAA